MIHMKKCVVISDSFKGTLSSRDICRIARESVPRFFPDCEVAAVPVADGGEGTVDCFREAIGAEPVTLTVCGPLGTPVQATYGRLGSLAIVEMAAAAGLPLVGEQKNPELTTTYGVGELLRHAVDSGCTEILLGLGGSATNDGGCGCAAALGVRFYDSSGNTFIPTGKTLAQLARIDTTETDARLRHVRITAMCDVENPLTGPTGAPAVFGPQKGSDPAMVVRLNLGLHRLNQVLQQTRGRSFDRIPGAGAAGGMGAGCMAFLNAELKPGIECVLDTVGFDRLLDHADLVITGEGRLDSQSLHGKVISGVARRTAPRHIPLVALVGGIAEGADAAYALGVTAMFGIDRSAIDFHSFAPESATYYQRTLEDILRLLRAFECISGGEL